MDSQYQDFEIDALLEAILLKYGYDFREYARASLTRRVAIRMQNSGLRHISDMISKILYEEEFFELFLKDMSITVTNMFRNPSVFKAIKDNVFPKLNTYARINIWHVGCATGQEVYSMAILLDEAGLLKKSRLYATDYNRCSLALAQKGILSLDEINTAAQAYQEAGGTRNLTDYFHTKFDSAKIKTYLTKHITFAHHNLMRDQVFAEMHLILCRNVLIYFSEPLKNQVLNLLSESLIRSGFLVLGDKESLLFSQAKDNYLEYEGKLKIYRKKRAHELCI